jgi:hypothetical protein
MNELSKVFETEMSKKQKEVQDWRDKQKLIWDACLKTNEEIMGEISFLKEKGYSITCQNNTPYNHSEAQRGYFPNVRVNKTISVSRGYSGKEGYIKVGSLGRQFPLMGEWHTYESFMKKLIKGY